MKHVLFILVTATFLPWSLYGSEPSAFGAGDLDSPSPYGLTKNEKIVLENKKKLEGLSQKTFTVNSKIDALRERVDGFQTVVETVVKTSNQNSLDLNALLQNSKENAISQGERNQKIDDLIKSNSENIEKIRVLLTEMSSVVDVINKNYVSKDEFNNLVKEINDLKSLLGSKFQTASKPLHASTESMSVTQIFANAETSYKAKEYEKAKEYYAALLEKNYKGAYVNYMLGEISYKNKAYENAIAYYKESGVRVEKASYMPSLILHTALCMQKTKDLSGAKQFFSALVESYPKTAEAKEAKKILSRLK